MADNKEATPKPTVKDVLDGGTLDKLFAIQKYKNRNKLSLPGALKRLEESREHFALQMLIEMVDQRYEQLENYLKKQEQDDARDLFDVLVKRGVAVEQAYATAFGVTKTPAMPPTPNVIPAK